MMDIMKSVLENEEYMIKMRRHFHEFAEPSDQEDETVKTICAELDKMGVKYVDVPKGGVLAFIDGPNPGKTVLLRADIDALPMDEEAENLKGPKLSVSVNKGACHACGHDGHTAMLLVAAKVLNENKDKLNGKVILMFERGEEFTSNYVHIYKYIRDNNIHIDSAYGNHLYFALDSGKVSIRDNNVMAGALAISCKITGKGGHGSRPDESINPVDCFVAIYNGLASMRSRRISPFNLFTDIIPSVHVGTVGNIIADSLEFKGGARVFEYEDAEIYKKDVRNLIEHTAAAYNCTAELDLTGPLFAVKNDPACAQMARKYVGAAIGEERMKQVDPWMASECMSLHLSLWPGVFALIGIKNDEKGIGAPHHNGKFDLDEDVLKYGAAATVAYAFGFLESDIDTTKSPNKWKGSMLDIMKASERPAWTIKVLED